MRVGETPDHQLLVLSFNSRLKGPHPLYITTTTTITDTTHLHNNNMFTETVTVMNHQLLSLLNLLLSHLLDLLLQNPEGKRR